MKSLRLERIVGNKINFLGKHRDEAFRHVISMYNSSIGKYKGNPAELPDIDERLISLTLPQKLVLLHELRQEGKKCFKSQRVSEGLYHYAVARYFAFNYIALSPKEQS